MAEPNRTHTTIDQHGCLALSDAERLEQRLGLREIVTTFLNVKEIHRSRSQVTVRVGLALAVADRLAQVKQLPGNVQTNREFVLFVRGHICRLQRPSLQREIGQRLG